MGKRLKISLLKTIQESVYVLKLHSSEIRIQGFSDERKQKRNAALYDSAHENLLFTAESLTNVIIQSTSNLSV